MAVGNATRVDSTMGTNKMRKLKLPNEVRILLVLAGVALVFEVLGWMFVGQSFLLNKDRLVVMILQMSVIGIIAVGVTQVIITGGDAPQSSRPAPGGAHSLREPHHGDAPRAGPRQ